MKLFITVLALVTFISPVLSNNNILEKSPHQIKVKRMRCSDVALMMGTLAEDAGGSFYEAYFGAYSSCIGSEFGI